MYFLVALFLTFKYAILGLESWEELRNQFAAFALITSWSFFIMETAKLFTPVNIYVIMLRKILRTMLVIAVSLHFYSRVPYYIVPNKHTLVSLIAVLSWISILEEILPKINKRPALNRRPGRKNHKSKNFSPSCFT